MDGEESGDKEQPALALEDADPEDITNVHRVAMQVLRSIPAEMVNISTTIRVKTGPDSFIKVHFDKCSHASGKQRAYVACPAPHHAACFRYGVVEQWPTLRLAAATLAAWALGAEGRGREFSKEDHKKFNPEAADVLAMLDSVECD